MPNVTRTPLSDDEERDGRLSHAMDLLSIGANRRRNGALPLAAIAGLALSGALLATIAGGEPQKVPARPSTPAAAAVSAPTADFELSGSSVEAPAATAVMAGTEKGR